MASVFLADLDSTWRNPPVPMLLNKFIIFCVLSASLTKCRDRQQFEEMPSSSTGMAFRNEITETKYNNIMTYEYTYNGGGVAVGDINNDGLADIYFSGNSTSNKLFVNKGEWKFEDITQQSNIRDRPDWKTGVTMADVNGDGWLDIYLCYSGNTAGEGLNRPVVIDHPKRANQLFINQGCKPGGIPTFLEQAATFGIDAKGTFSTQGYFLDYDLDGDLDLFLLNHANMFYRSTFNVKRLRNLRHPYFGNKLYRNDNNRFTEVSDETGIHGSGLNFGLSASISDINKDGWPDIYVTNDYDEQDFCYINNRNGTFAEVSHKIFGHLSKFGMGSDIADINNDGLPDIFVVDMLPEDNYRQKLLRGGDEYDKYSLFVDSGYHHQYMRNTLQLNRGFAPDSLPRFSEVAQMAGISNTDWSWAPLFADFDNDGLKDLFITNGYLRDYTNLDFQKYVINEAVQEANNNNHPIDQLAVIQKIPSTKLNKYFFKNTDGFHFSDASADWGLERKAISNAAAYADLDNDGDLDLVVNNLNDEVSVLQNHQSEIQKNNYIKLKLVGKKPNTQALGAKVTVTYEAFKITHEAYFTRGYQSSVEPVITIGVGASTVIQSVVIVWPDHRVTTLSNVEPNQILVVDQEKSIQNKKNKTSVQQPLLVDNTKNSGIHFEHIENAFVDFKFQRLVPYQFSRLGGKLSVADVNNDSNDDVFFGGAHGHAGKFFLGRDDGSFTESPIDVLESDKAYEDSGSTFFDADGDGNLDLYVVSGGNEFGFGDPLYQDRLYKGYGNGQFMKTNHALPEESTSGSCVRAADFDKDGDLDLFIGGRLVPGLYPATPKSTILRNDSEHTGIHFSDATKELNEDLLKAGMVTDAIWEDVNRDGWPDLVMVGEWMQARIFMNEEGKHFKEVTKSVGLDDTYGWWSDLFSADVDHDGDMDFLLGNAGLNLQLKTSPDEPVTLHAQDINNDGEIDPILCYYIQGKSYPLPTRDELLEQVTPLRKKFKRYADYANATIVDVVGEALSRSHIYTATTFQSSWLENDGDGKFKIRPLPHMAQLSSIQGFTQYDFDGDGSTEVLAVGNFYPYRVQLGRSDALMGVLMKFKNGEATIYKPDTPLWLTGDIRDINMMKFKDAPNKVVVSRNNDYASIYEIAKKPGIPIAKK